jgi:hypothetical protein
MQRASGAPAFDVLTRAGGQSAFQPIVLLTSGAPGINAGGVDGTPSR